MRSGRRALPLALAWAALGCAGGGSLRAQPSAPGPAAVEPTLDAVEGALDAGRSDDARTALERWFARDGERATRPQLARARFLRARLTPDAAEAEIDYLWVAIEGGPPYGALAWLRLAQLHLARGEAPRARSDLERLRADHPASGLVAESWLWTGYALEGEGDLPAACRAWESALRQAERTGPRPAGSVSGSVASVPPPAETASRARAAREACARDGLRFTVQLGAFRSRAGAEELAERVRAAGFEPRVERGRDGLHRVRVGRFGSGESAREAVDRLRARGFPAVVVSEGEE